VLQRPRFGFDPKRLQAIFDIMLFQDHVSAHPWSLPISPDPDDSMFLEVAAAADAPLVSSNLKHFPLNCRGSVIVITPAEFLATMRGV